VSDSPLDGLESDFERRMYNARHGLADDAEGANLNQRATDGTFISGTAPTEAENGGEECGDGEPETPVETPEASARHDGFVVVATAYDAVVRWYDYLMYGAVRVSGRVGPSAMVRSSPLKGLEVGHQIFNFVECTPTYEDAKLHLWIAARYERDELDQPTSRPLRRFMHELAIQLPRKFDHPRQQMSGIEKEEMDRRTDELRQAEIHERYRLRYPGLMRDGFDAGWRKGERKGEMR
jgi:hypothetical protein